MNYNTYRDVDHPFWSSTEVNNISPIFPNFWRSDPTSTDSLIDPRRSGYRPYRVYEVVSRNNKWIDSSCPVFQDSCDIIKPVNKCYLRNHEIITQP